MKQVVFEPFEPQEEKQGKIETVVDKGNAIIDKYQDKIVNITSVVLQFGILKSLKVDSKDIQAVSEAFDKLQEVLEEKIAEGIDDTIDITKDVIAIFK